MKTADCLKANSIKSNLCCHCGVCAGVCPTGAIVCENNILSVDANKCVDCGLCTYCCPATGYALSDNTLADVNGLQIKAACSKNKEVSSQASSGGFVTQALLTLLENQEITAAAVVLCGESLEESLAKYVITDNAETILAARRSKYTQATVDSVIKHIKAHEGRYAIVGLPCQLYGITKAMEKSSVLRERIAYKIGMVCGYTYDEACIDGLLKSIGVKKSEVSKVMGWREGGLPGSFSVLLKDGTQKSMPFADEHSIDVTYYAQNRCRLCKDCLCEHGDVVCADIGGWKQKKTLVMVRSDNGKRLVKLVESYDAMNLENCNIPYEKTVLPFMLREKRKKVEVRTKGYQKKGLPTPNFIGGYTPRVLLSHKLAMFVSIAIENAATRKRKKHSGKQMLKTGSLAYYKFSSKFFLKVLYKLQVYFEKMITMISAIIKKVLSKLPCNRTTVFERPLRVAVVGLGQWGVQYIGFMKRSKHYRLVAAYDADEEKLKGLAKKHRFRAAKSIEDLCENYGAEAVFVLTSTPTHFDVYHAISVYGLPVYMEKPISADMKTAAEMVEISQRNQSVLYVAHSMKYEPAIMKIKELASGGRFGKITEVKAVRTVKDKGARYENCALYQIGVHLIDVVRYIFGDLSNVKDLTRRMGDTDITETVNFCLNEAGVSLHYGFCNDYNFSLTVVTEKAVIIYADSVLTIYENQRKKQSKIKMQNEKTIDSQLNEFYFAVTKGKEFLNTANHAYDIIKLCNKITSLGE